MDKPIYEIPVTPPGNDQHGWIPGISAPPGGAASTPAPIDPFEALGVSDESGEPAEPAVPIYPAAPPAANPVFPAADGSVAHAAAAPPRSDGGAPPVPAFGTPVSAAPAPPAPVTAASAYPAAPASASLLSAGSHASGADSSATPFGEPLLRRERVRGDRIEADAPPSEEFDTAAGHSTPSESRRSAAPAPLTERPRTEYRHGAEPGGEQLQATAGDPSAQAAPTQATPTLAAPAQAAPTQAEPAQAAPPLDAPTQAQASLRVSTNRGNPGSGPDPELLNALTIVLDRNASDLHVTVGAVPSIRLDGGLRAIEGYEVWMRDKVTSALHSLLSPDQLAEYERELELDFAFTTAGARFRVNYYQQRNSMGAAFRLIPREIKQLDELGVPASVGHFSTLPRGLVLVTGPTGSGKSTTLAALIDLVNRNRHDHIVTVEDPIEFLHKHQKSLVNQREVGSDTHSFAAALKHVLRQDPDVILVGELRDLETISVALTAAETGHLVFATLHTQNAAQTIDRMIDVFPPHQQGQVRSQLAATLQGVVCQTLVKKASGKGRVVATEVMIATPAVSNLIREGKTYQLQSAMQAGRDLGMYTMDQHLAELVDNGKITRRAAEEKAQDPLALKQLIQRVESPSDIVHDLDGDIDFGDVFSTGRSL